MLATYQSPASLWIWQPTESSCFHKLSQSMPNWRISLVSSTPPAQCTSRFGARTPQIIPSPWDTTRGLHLMSPWPLKLWVYFSVENALNQTEHWEFPVFFSDKAGFLLLCGSRRLLWFCWPVWQPNSRRSWWPRGNFQPPLLQRIHQCSELCHTGHQQEVFCWSWIQHLWEVLIALLMSSDMSDWNGSEWICCAGNHSINT